MSKKDFIPRKNADFHPWQENFVTKVNLYITGWGLSTDATDEWSTLTSDPGNKKKRYEAAWAVVSTGIYTVKDSTELRDARTSYESGIKRDINDTSIRMFISRYIRNNPKVTHDEKVDMGIVLRDSLVEASPTAVRTKFGNDLAGHVRSADYLVHILQVDIKGQTSRARPAGVKFIQIFMHIAEASVTVAPDPTIFASIGFAKRGLLKHDFTEVDEGKKAWYYACYLYDGKQASYGPRSPIWNALIM